MKFEVAVLPGDGVGPEVTAAAVRVLEAVGRTSGKEFALHYGDIGGISIDNHGVALTDETLRMCKRCDAVLLGAVGGPKWDDPLAKVRPEDGLLAIRKALGLFANLRPVRVLPVLVDSTSLKPEIIRGVDMVIVRELTGGLYFGKPKRQWRTSRGRRAVDTMAYSEMEIDRIVRAGFELAPDYPDVELDHQLVDACAMRLIQRPTEFDVIVTENTFGDILTDEASMLAGSMGMLPSASIAGIPQAGKRVFGLYEPIHGSSPRRAGLDMANPIATTLSGAMMLRYSLGLAAEADGVERAIDTVLDEGYRTYDIMSEGMKKVGTTEMGELIAGKIS
jgi:3-isopropylmalate dehydrogenase